MIVATFFLSILNQMDFNLVKNGKQNCDQYQCIGIRGGAGECLIHCIAFSMSQLADLSLLMKASVQDVNLGATGSHRWRETIKHSVAWMFWPTVAATSCA